VTLDGQLNEPFWQGTIASHLLPRDPQQPNDNPTSIRFAWTTEALYVGIEQPADKASATMGITLMGADRKGIQLSLYAPKNNGPLVGTQPNWHSGYYRSLRLANPTAD